MIIATFPTYTQVLPGFEQAISGLRNQLLPIMSVLMIASLVGVAKEGYRAILFHLIFLTILVGLAANWQPWFQQASTAVSTTFTGDQYDLGKQTERYLIRLQVKAEQKDSDEGYVEAFFRAIMAGALLLLGYIAKGIVLLFLVLQKILLTFAYALSPIFVGFFALRSTRSIAVNYVMTTVGLISWPLGFALSACGTYGLVQFFGNLGFFSVAGNVLMLNEAFFALLIIAVWLLVSTIISPVIISKVMATGAQAGSALLSGVANTVAAATGAAVTTGATLAGGAAVAGAGAAAGGAGGGAPAASGAGTAIGSTGGGSAGVGAALRAATGAMIGGGASLVDAAMSGGNGHGAMTGAVASVVRGKGSGQSSGSSSGRGGSQSQPNQPDEVQQPNSADQPPASPTSSPSGGGSATPPPLPGSAGGTPASKATPQPPASASTAASGVTNPSAGSMSVVPPPQTPNHAPTSPSPSAASAAGTPAASATPTAAPSTGVGTTGGGTRGGSAATGRRSAASTRATADTSLDGEVARIIDFDTGKPITGDSLPKPGN